VCIDESCKRYPAVEALFLYMVHEVEGLMHSSASQAVLMDDLALCVQDS